MKFNVRVYGILIHDGKILLTKESRYGRTFTKFPGGGLEFGEGTKECLIREFEEEFGLPIRVGELIYINDFYQASAFNKEAQVLSVYYYVFPIAQNFSPNDLSIKEEIPVWIKLQDLTPELLTFPIDKILVEKVAR